MFEKIQFPKKNELEYFDMSLKANYNYEKPFISLLRSLVKDPKLMLVEGLVLPAEKIIVDRHHVC